MKGGNIMFTRSEFIIDNIKSSDLGINGVSIIRLDNEMEISTPWIGGKDIIEEKIVRRDMPYFYGTSKQPLEFSLKFSILDDEYTLEVLFQLGKIFGSGKYVSFQSTDFIGKIFYVIATSPINLITYGYYKGWYEVTLRNCAPYAFSLPEISTFNLSHITSPTIIEIYSKSNVPDYRGEYYYYPEIHVDLVNDGTDIIITNLSDGGRQTQLIGCNPNDSVYMNGQLKQIHAENTPSIFSKFNKNWFRLIYGLNRIQITHSCKIQFKCQYPLYV